jgi:8-oxo-dGTP pyrophosphatase MutT (NUDIX family)
MKLKREPIEPKASLVVVSKGKVLLSKAKDDSFVRPPGGHIEYFESSKAAVKREIKEEMGSGVNNLKLEKVIENLFYFEGKRSHDIYFIYSGSLTKKDLYKKSVISGDENGKLKRFYWITIGEIVKGKEKIVPNGILEVVLRLNKT